MRNLREGTADSEDPSSTSMRDDDDGDVEDEGDDEQARGPESVKTSKVKARHQDDDSGMDQDADLHEPSRDSEDEEEEEEEEEVEEVEGGSGVEENSDEEEEEEEIEEEEEQSGNQADQSDDSFASEASPSLSSDSSFEANSSSDEDSQPVRRGTVGRRTSGSPTKRGSPTKVPSKGTPKLAKGKIAPKKAQTPKSKVKAAAMIKPKRPPLTEKSEQEGDAEAEEESLVQETKPKKKR